MAETGILAQSSPAASTLTDMLTVTTPQAVATGILACNQVTGSITVRIAISPGGAAIAASHYIAYDVVVGPGRTIIIDFPKQGIRLGSGTVVRVYASDTASFILLGD